MTRGGHREGSGRPTKTPDKKRNPEKFYCTKAEKEQIKDYLNTLRVKEQEK